MKARKHLTLSEVDRLIDATRHSNNRERDACLIEMCFSHGFRVSELNALRLSDIDMEEGVVHIHRLKNGLSTMHPLYSKERALLLRWLQVRDRYCNTQALPWLFLTQQGQQITRQRIYALLRKCGINAGLTIIPHPHMLRHACGYALADKGIDTRLIQDYLGHRNISHTVIYTAANMQRFFKINPR